MKRFLIFGVFLIALQFTVCQNTDAQSFSVEDSSLDTTGAFYLGDEILSPGLPSPGFVPGLGSGAGIPMGFPVEVDGFTYGRHFMINPQNPFTSASVSFSVDIGSGGLPMTAVMTEAAIAPGEQNYDVYGTTLATIGTNFQIHDGNGVGPGGTAFPLGMGEPQGPVTQPFGTGTDGYDSRSVPGPDIYWTWDPTSPLPPPPGTLSGADIMISPSAPGYALLGGIYAPSFALGLDTSIAFGPDNVDALEVFDFGTPGVFDPTDVIFFSLDPTSGSLFDPAAPFAAIFSGASTADVFFATGGGAIGLAIPAGALGLTPFDNLDALSIVPEPSTTLICLIGFGLVAAQRRRRI